MYKLTSESSTKAFTPADLDELIKHVVGKYSRELYSEVSPVMYHPCTIDALDLLIIMRNVIKNSNGAFELNRRMHNVNASFRANCFLFVNHTLKALIGQPISDLMYAEACVQRIKLIQACPRNDMTKKHTSRELAYAEAFIAQNAAPDQTYEKGMSWPVFWKQWKKEHPEDNTPQNKTVFRKINLYGVGEIDPSNSKQLDRHQAKISSLQRQLKMSQVTNADLTSQIERLESGAASFERREQAMREGNNVLGDDIQKQHVELIDLRDEVINNRYEYAEEVAKLKNKNRALSKRLKDISDMLG
jgi:hypothetical protein